MAPEPAGVGVGLERHMAEALRLARRGWQATSPNPMVGALVVRGERVLGRGWHRRWGGPHAEVEAIRDATRRHGRRSLSGADLVVTLEPCGHAGKTPPCSRAIEEAGFGRVIFAARDPNPATRGRGPRHLRSRGVEVLAGVLDAEARDLNAPYFHWRRTGRPWTILKWAMTADGKIATHAGDSRWISGESSRRHAHALRRRVDGVLVGTGTALEDDPSLLPRPARGRHPLRVILDRRGRLPLGLQVFQPGGGSRVCFTSTRVGARRRRELESLDVDVVGVSVRNGRLDLGEILDDLGRRGVSQLLVEGGEAVHGAFLDADLAQEVAVFVAPTLFGGSGAPGPVGGDGAPSVAKAWAIERTRIRRFGPDVLIEGRITSRRNRP